MHKLLASLMTGAALVLAASAGAGGWATAGLGPPPDDIRAGETWNAEVTILQHGRTPLAGVRPAVVIRNAKTGATKRFRATPTDTAGVYRAQVRFPSGGAWRYEVYDGFTAYGGAKHHTFAPVDVASAAGGDGARDVWVLAGVLLFVLTVPATLLALSRRTRLRPARAAPSSFSSTPT